MVIIYFSVQRRRSVNCDINWRNSGKTIPAILSSLKPMTSTIWRTSLSIGRENSAVQMWP